MADLRFVSDPADPRLAAYRDVRERDLTRGGELIAEGKVVLDPLLASPFFEPVSLLVSRHRLAGLEDLLERLPEDCPVFLAERAAMDAIAGFPVHRGILAHARRRPGPGHDPASLAAGLVAGGGVALVGIGLANHDNVGALFRNAAAFGARFVMLDAASCDPFYRKAIRVSVGAVFTVPAVRVASGADALAVMAGAGVRCLALSPAGSTPLAELEPGGAAALFLGAEGPGLAAALMARLETVRIEMAPGLDSLNVATAAAIVLYRLFSAALEARAEAREPRRRA